MPENPISPHFIVIVPGYMGSLLRDKNTQEKVWLDIPSFFDNPFGIGKAIDQFLEKLAYPNEDLEPAGLMDQVLIVPPFAKQEHYGRLVDELSQWGYQINPANPMPNALAAYTFPYDWRQDNRKSARQLGEAIIGWQQVHPMAKAWIIAHSNGGIVSRWYIQKEGGDRHVEKLFLMGSPWDGAPKALKILLDGLDVLGLVKLNRYDLGRRLGEIIRSFPSFYQLIPVVNPFVRDENNQVIDLFSNPSWLAKERDRELLADARIFNQEISAHPQVETICFYGDRKPTTTAAITQVNSQGKYEGTQWIETGAGDGTVPVRSACHPWFEDQKKLRWRQHPVSHGDIYIDLGVLGYLHQDILGTALDRYRDAMQLPDINIIFAINKDFYTPGEEMEVWVDLSDPITGEPVVEATISAWLADHQPLPGSSERTYLGASLPTQLLACKNKPGHYIAKIQAPEIEGYYHIQAAIRPVEMAAVQMEELVIIEASP